MSRVGFIGFGRMGRALAAGAISARVLKSSGMIVCDPHVRPKRSISDVIAGCDLVFLCVKPQKMAMVLDEIERTVSFARRKKVCFVSIAAGWPLKRFEKILGQGVSVFRAMPNTPALLNAGMSGLSRGRFATATQERRIVRLLKSVGDVVVVPESSMDALTAVSGSGPAYVFYVAEAMVDAARSLKLPSDIARRLVHQTIFGAGRMLNARVEDAAELRRQVTSPNGTTAAAIEALEKADLKQIFQLAISKAARRAAELATES